MIDLIIFDIDGTLAQSSKLNLLPGAKDFFDLVLRGNCERRPKIAIATNQGGVGLRYWMERDHFGTPGRYPTQAGIEERIEKILAELGVDSQVPVYVSYRYKDKHGKISPLPPGKEGDPHWQPDWRKPEPGMLLQAARDAGVRPEQSMYVGDRDEDQGAALAAGTRFEWAKDFFKRDWGRCETLKEVTG